MNPDDIYNFLQSNVNYSWTLILLLFYLFAGMSVWGLCSIFFWTLLHCLIASWIKGIIRLLSYLTIILIMSVWLFTSIYCLIASYIKGIIRLLSYLTIILIMSVWLFTSIISKLITKRLNLSRSIKLYLLLLLKLWGFTSICLTNNLIIFINIFRSNIFLIIFWLDYLKN